MLWPWFVGVNAGRTTPILCKALLADLESSLDATALVVGSMAISVMGAISVYL